MKTIVRMLAIFCIAGLSVSMAGTGEDPSATPNDVATDPLNATYWIDGSAVRLIDGRAETAAAPGSVTKVRTHVSGQPVYGDMNGDGKKEAALLLVHDPGGSGTFYYAAAALNFRNRYHGTNGVLLGDRIIPSDIRIHNGVLVIQYADRRPEEPMSAEATVVKSAALILEDNRLEAAALGYQGELLYEGHVTIGHEVRSFKPCNRMETLWLMGKSPALTEIKATYRRTLPDAKPYQPLFMVLAGKWVGPPADGFGAEYKIAFMAMQMVRAVPGGDCTGKGFPKVTFDITRLDEDGLLGSADAKRSLAYEFCIPAAAHYSAEVKRIDPTVQFTAESPGRIGCGPHEYLCIGSTHQEGFRRVLQQLGKLPYVQRIDEAFFE